jgi:hypothetical protein
VEEKAVAMHFLEEGVPFAKLRHVDNSCFSVVACLRSMSGNHCCSLAQERSGSKSSKVIVKRDTLYIATVMALSRPVHPQRPVILDVDKHSSRDFGGR